MHARLGIEQAVAALRQGRVIACPTEAVWGLGCDPFNQKAVENLLVLKQRPVEKGLILVAADLQQLLPYLADISAQQKAMLEADSDRPTTWLVPFCADKIPRWITGEHHLLAVRISRHPLIQTLCRETGMPLVSSSANPQSLPEARSTDAVRAYFGDQLPLCEGELGDADRPSRIINLLTGEVIRD